MFIEYDKCLSSRFSSDYWADEGIGLAAGLLGRFSNADWDALQVTLRKRPKKWVIRCAESLGDVPSEKSLGVLLEILDLDDEDVIVAALDSLRSLLIMGVEFDSGLKKVAEIVKKLRAESSGVLGVMLDALAAQLETKKLGEP